MSIKNTKAYVQVIRDALIKADPEGAQTYRENAKVYMAKLEDASHYVDRKIANIPKGRRQLITSHDAFGYLAEAYGLVVLAAQGVSTESEASPKGIASLIRQIRRERVPAVFVESIADPRLMEQVARESGARLGGRLYSDALSAPGGPASTYLDLMRANLRTIAEALKG